MSVLNFFGGLAQGLGQTVIPLEAEARQREHDKRLQQLDVLHSAYKEAADRGDNEKAAEALNMMAPLLGAKEGKPHPIYAMRDMILNAKPITTKQTSQEGLAAQENINNTQPTITQPKTLEPQLVGDSNSGVVRTMPGATSNEVVDNPALKELTRPRNAIEDKVLQKGFYPTYEEKANRELRAKVNEEKTLLPIKKELLKAQTEAWVGKNTTLQNTKHTNKLEEIKAQVGGKALQPFMNNLAAIASNPDDPTDDELEKARALTLKGINATIGVKESKTNLNSKMADDYETRHKDRVSRMQNDRLRIAAMDRNYASLDSYRNFLKQDKSKNTLLRENEIQQKFGEGKMWLEKLKDYEKRRSEIVPQLRQQEGIMSNVLVSPEEKARAQGQIEILQKQYDDFGKEIDNFTGMLNNASVSSTSKTITKSTGPANKILKTTHKVGDVVTVQGKKVKISKVYSDGTFDGDFVQ